MLKKKSAGMVMPLACIPGASCIASKKQPDIAFVRAMIAQRQGAIELAKVRLQYGKDEQTRKWADDTIQRQQAEIDEMQTWLEKQVK